MKRRMASLVFLLAGLMAVFSGSLKADEQAQSSQAESRDEKLSKRLDAIEQKENDILKQLEDIKAELYIVKIRASLKT